MKSFTTLRNLFGTLTNNSASANLTLGDELINDSYRQITSERNWWFLQTTSTFATVASTQFYTLPANYDELISIYVTIGSYQYTPKEAPSRVFWDNLNQSTSFTSNFPEWYFIYNGTIGLWPTPSGVNTATISFKQRVIDLSMADYTTQSVAAATNASTTITGTAGTSWTAPMAGRYLRITPSNTAASSGDGLWYKIASVSAATTIVLTNPYLGTSIGAAAAAPYTIGQMPILPEEYQFLPVYRACELYFSSIQPEPFQSSRYAALYDQMHDQLIRADSTKSENVDIASGSPIIVNPNMQVTLT